MHNSNPQETYKVVVYTAYPWDHALTLLRLVDPLHFAGLELLKGSENWVFYPEKVSQADLVVIQRDFPRWEDTYYEVMRRARAAKKPVIYETDDWLFELPEAHPDRLNHYYAPALLPILRAVIEADAVTTTTATMREYLRTFNPNIYLLPNYMDDRRWVTRDPALADPDSPVIIGYMGSTTHKPDLDELLPVFQKLLDRCDTKIRLRFWGGEPPEKLSSDPRVEWIPLQIIDYGEFASYFANQQAHIFIAPLKDNPFNRSKSAIKFLEYSALGIPGVYSRIEPYESLVRHGENGFLAASLDEWEASLVALIEDPSLRHKIGEQAAAEVRQDWLLSQHAQEWREVYSQVLALPAASRLQNLERNRLFLSLAEQVQRWQRAQQASNEAVIAEKDREIRKLQAESEALHASHGWAFLQRLLAIRRWLIPVGSSRERLIRSLFRLQH